jgi:VIT1/CCC1 family predicted Fe2+/Mn2+ transporter
MPVLTQADLSVAVFGAWDGCISVLAALLAARNADTALLLAVGLGASVGGTFSMATGQFESMDKGAPERLRESLLMGVATLAGGLIVTLPFVFGDKTWGFVLGITAAWLLATVVWLMKREGWVGAIRTYALLILTVAATVAVGFVG